MLNAKALGELLTKNRDDRLCKRWFIMTPNGTLLAYSEPLDIKDLRRQAAMAAISWQEHQSARSSSVADDGGGGQSASISLQPMLKTLTIESEASNFIIRKLQPQLLLVVEGGVPPRKRAFHPRVTSEGPDDTPYPSQSVARSDSASALPSSASSISEGGRGAASLTVLGLQRRKLDAMASAIAQVFEQSGFKMPEESSNKFF